jgi:hypothetical protein
MAKTSPTKRSLAMLREEGWTCQIVEKWNPFARVRQDLFGFIDILCIGKDHCGILGVQTTVAAKVNERFRKISKEPRAWLFRAAGGSVIIHGWKKAGKRHATPGKWVCDKLVWPMVIEL